MQSAVTKRRSKRANDYLVLWSAEVARYAHGAQLSSWPGVWLKYCAVKAAICPARPAAPAVPRPRAPSHPSQGQMGLMSSVWRADLPKSISSQHSTSFLEVLCQSACVVKRGVLVKHQQLFFSLDHPHGHLCQCAPL